MIIRSIALIAVLVIAQAGRAELLLDAGVVPRERSLAEFSPNGASINSQGRKLLV